MDAEESGYNSDGAYNNRGSRREGRRKGRESKFQNSDQVYVIPSNFSSMVAAMTPRRTVALIRNLW